jgi:hypothetical protein
MNRRSSLVALSLLASLLTSACWPELKTEPETNGVGDPYFNARDLRFGADTDFVSLAPGEVRQAQVTFCPPVVDGRGDPSSGARYLGGAYRMEVSGLPPGVTASFPNGAVIDISGSTFLGQAPSGGEIFNRYCWQGPLELRRDATPGEAPEVSARLSIQLPSAPLPGLEPRAEQRLRVALRDPGGGTPPPVAGSCHTGRWTDQPAPDAERGSAGVFDATLLQDRLLLARGLVDRVRFDEQIAPGWRSTVLAAGGAVDQLSLAVARQPDGRSQPLAAWRDTNFSRPREEANRVVVARRDEATSAWTASTVAADFDGQVRQLRLVAWQGDALVAWVSPAGLQLRRPDPADAAAPWQVLPAPAELAGLPMATALRLAVEPVSGTLVVALAVREADGITRLRSWRLAAPTADWQALPVLQAGESSGPGDLGRGLGDMALSVLRDELVLAWSYGEALFTLGARQTLQVMRATVAAPAWQALGDPATLSLPGTRYAVQMMSMQLAQGCGGATFLAWSEPADYPRGAVHGAVADAAGLWDPMARADLAPLPGGTGAFSSSLRLVLGDDGRPWLVAVLASPSGGPSPVVLRRYAP